MARNPRNDTPGSWHHVMNRGVAKRTLFEGEHDVRFFQSRLASAVRRGQIEVHAWSILTTHFHLLVRSPVGELSAAMRRIQNDYSRRFNRTRRRDGPLVRGRFRSKPVGSLSYRRILVRYIDANAIRAKLALRAVEYRHGSARWFARASGPPWHERGWVEEEVCRVAGIETYEPAAFEEAFPREQQGEIAYVVERRLSPKSLATPGADLLETASSDTMAWMQRKARLADGTSPGLAVAAPQSVLTAVAELAEAAPGDWRVKATRQARDPWSLLRIGLLRDLTGATWQEIGRSVQLSASRVASLGRQHARLLVEDREYAERAA